jgi:hypothetical protein
MTQILTGKAAKNSNKHARNAHIIGGLALAYLGMVSEFGYIITLMRSGLLLRQQFFNPNKFHKALGTRYQLILTGEATFDKASPVWKRPFSFKFDGQSSLVTVRNFVVRLPMTQDPLAPIARHLKIVPHKYTFRPNFQQFLT